MEIEDTTIKSLKGYEGSKEIARETTHRPFPPLDSRSGWLEGLGSNGSFVSRIFSGCGRRFNEDVLRAVFRRNCFFVAPRTWQRPCPKVRIRTPPVGMEFTFDVNKKKKKETFSIPCNDSRVFISAGFCGPSRFGPVRRVKSNSSRPLIRHGIDRGDVDNVEKLKFESRYVGKIYIDIYSLRNRHGGITDDVAMIARIGARFEYRFICENRGRGERSRAQWLRVKSPRSESLSRDVRNARETQAKSKIEIRVAIDRSI